MTTTTFPHEAARLLHLLGVGPRPLARVADCSPSTASTYLAGSKKPNDDRRLAIELELGIQREAWDRRPVAATDGMNQLWLLLRPCCRVNGVDCTCDP